MKAKKSLKIISPFFLFFLTVFVLYFKTLFYELTYLDDNVWILDYQWYLKDLSNFPQLFTRPDLVTDIFYRPVLNTSFMLNAFFSGEDLFGFRVTNLLFHVLSASLIFCIFQKMGYSKKIAAVFSVFFIVHPALTQAVVWIPGRTDSLLGVLVLSSFLFFLQYLDEQKNRYLLGHLCFWILALLTKETAVVLPFLCILYSVLIEKVKPHSFMNQKKFNQAYGLGLFIVFWVLTYLALFLTRSSLLAHSREVGFLIAVQSVMNNLPSVICYFGKIFLPVNLSVMPILEDMPLIYGFISLIMVSGALIFSKKKRLSYVIFGLIWFLFFLLPSLIVSFLKHEYRLYLPLMGVMIVVLELDYVKEKMRVVIPLGIFLILLCSAVTFTYSGQFKDRNTFWKNAVKNSPHSPLAHRNRGAMYYLEGKKDKAIEEYNQSLALNPSEPMAHNNIGLIYMDRGDFKTAEEEFKKEIAVNPKYDTVHFNLGLLYYKQKRFDEAVLLWKHTIQLNPKFIAAYKYLAMYHYNSGDAVEAEHYLKELEKRGVLIRK